MTPTTFNQGTTPVVLEQGTTLTVRADAFAVGQIDVPGTNDVRTLAASGVYTFGPYTDRKQVVCRITGGSVTVATGDNVLANPAAVSNTGLRMLVIGASTEARIQTMWNIAPANYSRAGGVATIVFDYTLQDKRWLPGQKLRVAADRRADVEGVFEVITSTISAGVSGTVTLRDPRPDIAGGSIDSGAVMALHDPQTYSITGGFPAIMNMGLGGRLDVQVLATGSTNVVTDWSAERLAIAANLGQFDIVHVGCGILGNAINGGGYTVTQTYNALVDLVQQINARLRPRVITIETLPPTAQATLVPTNPVVTAAYRLNRKLWRDLPRQLNYIRIVPCGEALAQNYGAYNAAPSTDVQNSWGEANAFATDGVHPMYAWTRIRGLVIADVLRDLIAQWASPEMGVYPDTKAINNVADAEGYYNPNRIAGMWGNVDATKVTLANTGCSGSGPAGASCTFEAGRGTSVAVGSLQTNPAGGADWVVTITGNGSSTGYTFVAEMATTELLTAIQDSTAQGKEVDVFLPLTLQIPVPALVQRILWVSVDLVVTVGGVEYVLASAQAQDGQFTMAAQGRAMDGGYSGVLRFPRFKLPTATYTAAKFRVRVKEINGSIASGTAIVRWGPGQRFEVLEG